MAYVAYGQGTVGGKQVAEAMAGFQNLAAKMRNLSDWVGVVGAGGLEASPDFQVGAGDGQAFNDTFLQIAAAFESFMGDGTGGTNREKIARLARGY